MSSHAPDDATSGPVERDNREGPASDSWEHDERKATPNVQLTVIAQRLCLLRAAKSSHDLDGASPGLVERGHRGGDSCELTTVIAIPDARDAMDGLTLVPADGATLDVSFSVKTGRLVAHLSYP